MLRVPTLVLCSLCLMIASPSFAASGDQLSTGSTSIVFEQKSADGTVGRWTLLRPDNETVSSGLKDYTLNALPAGNYTLFTEPPEGAVASIRIYRNDEPVLYVERIQTPFKVEENDRLRIAIHYTFTMVGLISVQSDPPGIAFKMEGPNNSRLSGTAPTSFEDVPKGQYQVYYLPPDGCVTPPPKSLQLEEKGRITFSIKIACEAAQRMREEQAKDTDPFVIITLGNREVTLRDVPSESWFGLYVAGAAKRGILSGYRDETGEPTGEFGPTRNVTVAELAKIAHGMADISEAGVQRAPSNPNVEGHWFSSFIASAEEKGWTIYADGTIDPLRDATRGEVLVTVLQALDIPMQWQKGGVFRDVQPWTPYAAAIETSAALKIVSGRSDVEGNATGSFGPNDPINRAEMAKIIQVMFEWQAADAARKAAEEKEES